MAHDTAVLQHYLKPLQACLEPGGVTEVVVNRPGELGIEREGGWEWRASPDLTETWLSTLAKAAFTAQDVTPETPICSTVLPGGERCQIVIPPAAERLSLTLGAKIQAFVRGMPQPDTQRLVLARELRAANARLGRNAPEAGKERGR